MVTGGAGFIGGNFVRHLINETKSKVINLDKLTYAGNLKNIKDLRGNKAHTFVKGDIRNRNLADSWPRGVMGGSCVASWRGLFWALLA